MKPQTKIHIIGWILVSILGFLKWQYPEESSIITSGFGGLIAVLLVFYLIFYPFSGSKDSVEK
ncbi:hypothetical protein GMD78_20330 [Ornithinibacillus sp. L9]|uniref:Uncharacterized protein n=1 Tax=Ornithinibacillus caprae TaxID=2678566 RepID=A0A6N8FP68_9BACI|nr:hypothetical protein [Ornithinibacillus caprae]MUK90706.1 hypothetical protein [Ornithinibacillus caprae]